MFLQNWCAWINMDLLRVVLWFLWFCVVLWGSTVDYISKLPQGRLAWHFQIILTYIMFKDFIWATSEKLRFHFSIGLVVSHVMILNTQHFTNPYAICKGIVSWWLTWMFHRAVEMLVDRAGEQLQLNGTTITDPNTGRLGVSMSQLGCGELSIWDKGLCSKPSPETLPIVVKGWHISRIVQILATSTNILK